MKGQERGEFAFYALGDAISSRRNNVTCQALDQLSQQAWTMYQYGNWAKRDFNQNKDFDKGGAEDFRFRIYGVTVQEPTDPGANPNNLRAHVDWEFTRTWNRIRDEPGSVPGSLIGMPLEYQVPGEFYIIIEGRNFVRPPLNILTFFGTKDYRRQVSYYFSPRYLPMIDLSGPWDPNHCEADP